MKKLLFTAIACVAFAFNGLASNEIVNELQNLPVEENAEYDIVENSDYPCKVSIYVINYNADGLPYIYDSITYGSNRRGSDCTEWASGKVKDWEKKFDGCEIKSVIISR